MNRRELGQAISTLLHLEEISTSIDQKLANTNKHLKKLQSEQRQISNHVSSQDKALSTLSENIHSLKRRIEQLESSASNSAEGGHTKPSVRSSNYDRFYKRFEDKFRGSEKEISVRAAEYIPLFKKLPKSIQRLPVLDIGCGRGEVLGILSSNGFHAIGVDINRSMIKRAKAKGLQVYQADALAYLRSLETSSLAAVIGLHIVEHMSFDDLMGILHECHRVVAAGGSIFFETPNPESLSVGAHTFYLDPSHQRPIPPLLLEFMAQQSGFSTQILRLHEIKPLPDNSTASFAELFTLLYGFADYTVIGTKQI